MRKKIPVLDTNIIIRFLTDDNKIQVAKIEKLLNLANKDSLDIPDLIIAEIVYVLLSVYELSKEETINKVSILIEFYKFRINRKLIKKTLEFFKENNISFIDAYLCALVSQGKNESVYSFDKRLLKIKNIKALEPK